MAEYSKIARGSFTTAASPVAQVVQLPFQPTRVKLLNYTAYSLPAQYAVSRADWDISMGQGVAAIEYGNRSSTPWTLAVDYVATSGISTFSGGQLLQFGPAQQIASTTLSTATITTAAPHGYATGDVVMLDGMYQSATTGSPQISGMPFTITVTGATTFTINWNMNQSNFTALSASPAGASVQKVLYPYIYEPGVAYISSVTTGASTTIKTTANHNFVVGQQIAFRVPAAYGFTAFNALPNASIPGSPVYYYVSAVTSNNEFVVSVNSTGFAAFNSNQPVSSVPGLQMPQVIAVGDVNTGGFPYTGGALYPSPIFGGVSSINGPAIQGAFCNNSAQGFIVGTGIGVDEPNALLLTPSSLYTYEAFFYDIG